MTKQMQNRIYKAEGIVLKRRNIGEADRMITIFTKEYGKLRLIAKGIRKTASRRAPHLEVFTRVTILIYSGKSMESISEVSPIAMYEGIRKDLQRVSLAYYLCDLVDSLLPEKQEHADVFTLMSEALTELETNKSVNLYSQSKTFTLRLLWTLGFLPPQKSLNGSELQEFIETITERKLKSTHFAKLLMDSTRP